MTDRFSRRGFLKGAACLGACCVGRAFAAPHGLATGAPPKLVLGVLSDIHVTSVGLHLPNCGDTADFISALRWFDSRGADGVIIAGDMAHQGMRDQLRLVGDAWFRVFPENKSQGDGRPVTKLFIMGNHDVEGWAYYGDFRKRYPDAAFHREKVATDRAAAWQEAFREPYSPIWHRRVKGYDFVGVNWGSSWDGVPEIEPWFKVNGFILDKSKPFFYIQHPHPGGTVYGKDAWCPDKGYAARALAPFPNAIAFSGHSHESLTDERSIWQGDFTSVATASLRYGGAFNDPEQRQGLLVLVYDDRVVLERHDFCHDIPVGDDWVLPIQNRDARPYGFAVRDAKLDPPEFAPGDRISVQYSGDGWKLEIPHASKGGSRAFRYVITADVPQRDGKAAKFAVYDARYHLPECLAGKPTRFNIPATAFPDGASPCFSVIPMNCFGRAGKALSQVRRI